MPRGKKPKKVDTAKEKECKREQRHQDSVLNKAILQRA